MLDRVDRVLRGVAVVLLLAASAGSGAEPGPLRSALLSAWAPKIASGGASDDFWRMVTSAGGTPLVERIPGDPQFVNVTFLFRSAAARSVAVIALENHQLANDRYFDLARLERLGSSDIWYRTYRLRSDARFTYRLSVDDERLFAALADSGGWDERLRRLTRDPLNPHDGVTRDGPVSLVELPDAEPLRWFTPVPGVAAGRLDTFHIGDRANGLDHAVTVYTPPRHGAGTVARNLLLVLDGEAVDESMPVPTILDNLQAQGQLDPTIAVMIANRPGKRVTDLWYSPELLAFVRDELLPWLRRHYPLPRDPRRVVIAGRSASGNAALYLAFELPSLIGNAISQSGGYALGARGEAPLSPARDSAGLTEDGFPQKEWLTRRIAALPRRPIRVHLEVGTLEDVAWEFPFPQYATPTVLLANRHLRDVLEAKGYAFTYREYNGPHDPLVWRGTFGDDLLALIGRGAPAHAAGGARRR